MKVNTQWSITNPLGVLLRTTIVQNNTTFVAPAAGQLSSLVIVIPPTTNTQQWQLKGNAGDVGIPMAPALPGIFGLPNTVAPGVGIGLAAGVDQIFSMIFL
jgi:hypothetical protein